jgi:hypothetical protein
VIDKTVYGRMTTKKVTEILHWCSIYEGA